MMPTVAAIFKVEVVVAVPVPLPVNVTVDVAGAVSCTVAVLVLLSVAVRVCVPTAVSTPAAVAVAVLVPYQVPVAVTVAVPVELAVPLAVPVSVAVTESVAVAVLVVVTVMEPVPVPVIVTVVGINVAGVGHRLSVKTPWRALPVVKYRRDALYSMEPSSGIVSRGPALANLSCPFPAAPSLGPRCRYAVGILLSGDTWISKPRRPFRVEPGAEKGYGAEGVFVIAKGAPCPTTPAMPPSHTSPSIPKVIWRKL